MSSERLRAELRRLEADTYSRLPSADDLENPTPNGLPAELVAAADELERARSVARAGAWNLRTLPELRAARRRLNELEREAGRPAGSTEAALRAELRRAPLEAG